MTYIFGKEEIENSFCRIYVPHCFLQQFFEDFKHDIKAYSLRFHIRSCLGQQDDHQSTTLTSLFCKNLYWKVIHVYSYESNFQDKSIYMTFTFSNSTT
jgi:hypothetical protein